MSVSLELIGLLGVLSVLELGAFYVSELWRVRRVVAGVVLVLSSFAAGMVAVQSVWPWGVLLVFTHIYRVVNLLRVIEGRMHEKYMRRMVRRSSWFLNMLVWLWVVLSRLPALADVPWQMITLIQLAAAVFLLVSTVINIRRSTYRPPKDHPALRDLPTITVAIPARNETTDLVECLESVLTSTYPKLEVIVLDDCSHTNTSDIIKKFAHRGVRFIAGEPPRNSWLAKNQAYDALADAATGEYLLFCGVDVRFAPDTITHLVHYVLSNNLSMVSVLPRRLHARHIHLVQPMRYWWELAPPRFWMNQPPSLSTCWLIENTALNRLGRFDAVSHRVRPETYFARETHKQKRYAFLLSSKDLEIISTKNRYDQFQTAIRVRYPEVRKRPEMVLLTTLAEALLFTLPFLQIPVALYIGNYQMAFLSFLTTLMLVGIQAVISVSTRLIPPLLSYIVFPGVILTELYLINESMRRYEFGQVTWRGRNICLPVMHTIPHLPKQP